MFNYFLNLKKLKLQLALRDYILKNKILFNDLKYSTFIKNNKKLFKYILSKN